MTKEQFDIDRWCTWEERASKFNKNWGSMLSSQRKTFKRQWYSLYGKNDIPEEFDHSQPMQRKNFKLTDIFCATNVPTVRYNYSLANNKVCIQEEETKENDMMTIERDQRNYFINRLSLVEYNVINFLEKKFNLVEDLPPKTLAEFVERITSGKFTPWKNKETKDIPYDSYVCDMFHWKDPNVLPDEDGLSKARDEMHNLTAKYKDKIMAAPIIELPALIEEFEKLGKAL